MEKSVWSVMDEKEPVNITLYLTVIEISKLNSEKTVKKTTLLPNGDEIVVNLLLSKDREQFSEEIREIVKE